MIGASNPLTGSITQGALTKSYNFAGGLDFATSNFQTSYASFSNAAFTARFASFIKPTLDATHSFRVTVAAVTERYRLYVDGSMLLDFLTIAPSATQLAATLDLKQQFFYDVQIDYSYPSAPGSTSLAVKLEFNSGAGWNVFAINSATTAHRGDHIRGSPYAVKVLSSGTCATRSYTTSSIYLTLATAGAQGEFTIQAIDLYGNKRETGGEAFKVRLSGVDSNSGILLDRGDGTYRIVYTATKTGTYDLSIVYGAASIQSSPFRLKVEPAFRHLQTSFATGRFLTLTTAGVSSTFTITVLDRHANWQPTTFTSSTDPYIRAFAIDSAGASVGTNHLADAGYMSVGGRVPALNGMGGSGVATPTTVDNPNLVIVYSIARSGSYRLVVNGTRYSYDGQITGSPFPLTVYPHIVCSSTSTASGGPLSIMTSGSRGTFTIQARDQFNNIRGTFAGDAFSVHVRRGDAVVTGNTNTMADIYGSVTDNKDSTYTASYSTNTAQQTDLWATVLGSVGVIATYYEPPSTPKTVISTIDFSSSVTQATTGIAANSGSWSARWGGYFVPTSTGTYTFTFTATGTGYSGGTLATYVAINNDSPSGGGGMRTAGTTQTFSYPLTGNNYYHIDAYLSGTGGTGLSAVTAQMQYTTAGGSSTTVIGRCRQHIAGSPFSITVKPTIMCTATSVTNGNFLTLSTAGVTSTFRVTAIDTFSNTREVSGDTFQFSLSTGSVLPSSGIQPSIQDGGIDRVGSNLTYLSNGEYLITYTPTISRNYQLRGSAFQRGGLIGYYYENQDLTDHPIDASTGNAATAGPYWRIDSSIDFQWSLGSPVSANNKRIGPDYFGVRWVGIVSPAYSEVYTFSAEVDDGVRLYVDDLLIVDFWYSRIGIVDGTIALIKDQFYSLKMEYMEIKGNATARLRWKSSSQGSEIVPSSRLYFNSTSSTLSGAFLSVEPTGVCASTSTVVGQGMSISTAGANAYFTVTVRDMYGNIRKEMSDSSAVFYARVVPVVSNVQVPYHMNWAKRLASKEFPDGLTATYYNTGGTALQVSCGVPNMQNIADATKSPKTLICLPLDSTAGNPSFLMQYSDTNDPVRLATSPTKIIYRGGVKPSVSGLHSFRLTTAGSSSATISFKIGAVDDALMSTVISQTSVASGVYAGSFQVPNADVVYDIVVTYDKGATAITAGDELKLDWYSTAYPSFTVVPSDRIFPLGAYFLVNYLATVKGDYQVQVSTAELGGIDATYYDDIDLSIPRSSFSDTMIRYNEDADVDFTTGARTVKSGLSDYQSFSARWVGMFKSSASASSTHTFQAIVKEANNRVKLWVDNVLLIDRWDTYMDNTLTSFSATTSLDPTKFYDIRAEYYAFAKTAATADPWVKVQVAHPQQTTLTDIPSSTVGTPSGYFKLRETNGSPFAPFEILPAIACATTSTYRGRALTVGTTGVMSSFTIQANDQYYNERGVGNDVFASRVFASSCPTCTPSVLGSVLDLSDSSYVVSYNITKAGSYRIRSWLLRPGLTAYICGGTTSTQCPVPTAADLHLTGPYSPFPSYTTWAPSGVLRCTAQPSTVDFSSSSSTGMPFACVSGSVTMASPYRLFWSGFLQAPSNASTYTFTVTSETSSTSTIYIDGNRVIASTAATSVTFTATFPTSNALYDINIDYKTSTGGSPRYKLEWAYGTVLQSVVPSSRLFGTLHPDNSKVTQPATDLTIWPTSTSAIASESNGPGLTLATAGDAASFTITTRDAYGNLRTYSEDSFFVQLQGTSITYSFSSVPSVSSPGRYSTTYSVTKAGLYNVNIIRPAPGGLFAEYFNNMWLVGSPADTSIDSSIDFNWGSGFVTPRADQSKAVTGSDYVSARWTGYFKPEYTETYTFIVRADDGFRLYLAGAISVDMWSGPSGEFSATVAATADQLMELKLEYKEVTDSAFVSLSYSSPSIVKRVVPSARLYNSGNHIFGSPFRLYVHPTTTCAATSQVNGAGLSAGTSGATTAFTITARDRYSNTRTDWTEQTYSVRLQPINGGGRAKIGTVSSNYVKARFNAQLIPTVYATSRVFVQYHTATAPVATYYTWASSNPQTANVGSPVTLSVRGAAIPSSLTSYALRWSAILAPTTTATYTFAASMTANDFVRVYVDNVLVLDKPPSSSTSTSLSTTIGFPTNSDMYEISVEVWSPNSANTISVTSAPDLFASAATMKAVNDIANSPYTVLVQPAAANWPQSIVNGAALTLATAGVQSQFTLRLKDMYANDRLLGGEVISVHAAKATTPFTSFDAAVVDAGTGTYTVTYTPTDQGTYALRAAMGASEKSWTLFVQPGKACSSTSTANGEGLSIATAGMTQFFTIQSKDEYKNLRTMSTNEFLVRLYSSDGVEVHQRAVEYSGQAPAYNLGKYSVYYRTTRSGTFSIDARMVSANGLNATYFRDEKQTVPVISQIDPTVNFNWGTETPHASVQSVDLFSVRWTGLVKPPSSTEYTFFVRTAETDERIKLWINDRWLVNFWTQDPGTTTSSGTVYLLGNVMYDVKLWYADMVGSSQVQLQWKASGLTQDIVPSSRLFSSTAHVAGSPFLATIFPALTCGTMSTVTGDGLTVSTSGIASSFTVQSRDHLGNLVTKDTDNYVVYVPSETGTTVTRNLAGTVTAVGSNSGAFAVTYVPRIKHTLLSTSLQPIVSSLALSGGLYATFYTSSFVPISKRSGASRNTEIFATIDDANTAARAGDASFSAGPFRIRWTGFFKPTTADVYTFTFYSQTGDTNAMIIDGVSAGAPATTISMTLQLPVANSFYSVQLDYVAAVAPGSSKSTFKYSTTAITSATIPSSLLFQNVPVTFNTFGRGGLWATYYALDAGGSTIRDMKRRIESTVDWSGADSNARPMPLASLSTGRWKARYQGFVNPSRRGIYTFYIDASASAATQTVSLYVDNLATGAVLINALSGSRSATFFFPNPNAFYDILVEYEFSSVTLAHTPLVKLRYESLGSENVPYIDALAPSNETVIAKIVPSDRLFYKQSGPTDIIRDDQAAWNFGVLGCDASTGLYRCRGAGFKTNPTLMTVNRDAVVCASTTTLTSPVTLMTTGVAATFSMTVRDSYNNLRDATDDNFVSRAMFVADASARPFHGTFAHIGKALNPPTVTEDNMNGFYDVALTVTRSGDFKMRVASADSRGRGLFATYFDRPNCTGNYYNQIDDQINFDWGAGAPVSAIGFPVNSFSARWTGLVKPQYSEAYTFFVNSNDGGRLVVNNVVLVDNFQGPSGEFSGSIVLVGGVLYDILVEYQDFNDAASVSMSWQSVTQSKQVVPSSRLFQVTVGISSSPFSLNIVPNIACATTSALAGKGLSIATSGISSTFTIFEKDMYFNARTVAGSGALTANYVVRLASDTAATDASAAARPINGPPSAGATVDTINIAYTPTLSGSHNLFAYLAPSSSSLGLVATYYDSASFGLPRRTTTDTLYSLASTSTPLTSLSSLAFTARWSGFFKAGSTSGYTFASTVATADQRVRLWVDGFLVIDGWTTASTTVTGGTTMGLTANTLYEIRIEFLSSNAAAASVSLALTGNNAAFLSNTYPAGLVTSVPFRVQVNPNVAIGSTSSITGPTLATAGVQGFFTVQARDLNSNARGTGGDLFYVRAVHTTAGMPIVRTSITDNGDSTYRVAYTGTKITPAGTPYSILSSVVRGSGLTSTYFTSVQTFPISGAGAGMRQDATVDFSFASNSRYPSGTGAYAAKWAGLVRPSRAQQYTFFVNMFDGANRHSSSRLRLTVDKTVVIDLVAGVGTATTASGTIAFGVPNGLYDLEVEYSVDAANTANGFQLQWQNLAGDYSQDKTAKAVIPSSRLFYYDPLSGTSTITQLTVVPAPTCASTSFATGGAVSSFTAGSTATFTITSKDMYQNDRDATTSVFGVSLYGSGGSPTVSGTQSAVTAPNLYSMQYLMTVAKSYELFVRLGSDNIRGSPFTVTIFPQGLTCGSKSTISGAGVYSAVANQPSVFTIQSRDQYSNAMTSGNGTFLFL